ncbi:2344_t:CDS:1, partial [Gigaspora rosea]
MPYNNTSINIHTLNSEQRCQFFLELFDMDPSLINALNSEQRHRLNFVLIAIDPLFTESLLDARSAVLGIINEQ